MTEVYAFSGKVETLDFGRMAYHVVYLPEKLRKVLPLDDPDAVDVPPELRHAVETNGRAAQIWEQMTAGKKRGLAYRVATAKRADTRQRRVETVMEEILDFGLERDL